MSNSHKTYQAVLYRILTEDKNQMKTIKLVSEFFVGFTVTYGDGLYKGVREACMVIEIIADYAYKCKVLKLAGEIKKLNGQELVLVFTTTGFLNEI